MSEHVEAGESSESKEPCQCAGGDHVWVFGKPTCECGAVPADVFRAVFGDDAHLHVTGADLRKAALWSPEQLSSNTTEQRLWSPPPESPDELRRRKEAEAWATTGVWGWGGRLILTTGNVLRFSCCGAAWGDPHSPWCRIPNMAVPADAGDWLVE